MDRLTAETSLSVCALALSLVMAGTGDLETFRRLRTLRCVDKETTHGNHMALAMAIGFVYLGGGRYTLGTSPEAIAALVVALFPRFPRTTGDNDYHLQA